MQASPDRNRGRAGAVRSGHADPVWLRARAGLGADREPRRL